MNASEGIQFIKAVKELGIREEAAEKIVSLVESRKGELATKADIVRLEASIEQLRTSGKKDIEQAERRLEASIDQLRQEGRRDIEHLEASIERLEEGQKEQREQSRQEIEQAERRLEEGQKRLEAGIKGNRWAIAIAISAIGLVFTANITGSIFFWGQISDMQANIQKLLQGQQKEQQAERTGNSAKQEGRISAADPSGS